MANEYKKLDKSENYDKEAAEELAQAINEIASLKTRIDQLKDLIEENQELFPFVWTTAEGQAIAVHKLEDDHLANILGHLARTGRKPNKGVRGEARKRGITPSRGTLLLGGAVDPLLADPLIDLDYEPF